MGRGWRAGEGDSLGPVSRSTLACEEPKGAAFPQHGSRCPGPCTPQLALSKQVTDPTSLPNPRLPFGPPESRRQDAGGRGGEMADV